MKLIYITEGVGPVFQSQVVELLNSFMQNEVEIDITLLVGIRGEREKNQIINLHPSIKLSFFKVVPLYPVLDLISYYSLVKVLQKLNITSNTVIHTRGEYLGALSYRAIHSLYQFEPRILIDVRGALIEEISIYLKPSTFTWIKLKYIKYLYAKYINKAKYLNAVTPELKKYLIEKYSIQKDKIYVANCIAGKNFVFNNKKREEIRKTLGLKENETLFVFSTSSAGGKWQSGDDIVKAIVNQGYKVLMLSKKVYTINGVISRYVPYEEVSQYLMAADIGIIIRNNDTVNNVASPIKFSEYLSCGLPVVANDAVKLITEIVEENNCGLIVDSLENLERNKVSKLLALDRKSISSFGKKIFSIDTLSEKYIQIYKNL